MVEKVVGIEREATYSTKFLGETTRHEPGDGRLGGLVLGAVAALLLERNATDGITFVSEHGWGNLVIGEVGVNPTDGIHGRYFAVRIVVEDGLSGERCHHLERGDMGHQAEHGAELAIGGSVHLRRVDDFEGHGVGLRIGSRIAGGVGRIHVLRPAFRFHVGACQIDAGLQGLDLAEVPVEFDALVDRDVEVAHLACGGENGVDACGITIVDDGSSSTDWGQSGRKIVEIGRVGGVFGGSAEAGGRLVVVGEDAHTTVARQLDVDADLSLVVGGVLESFGACHFINVGVIDEELAGGIVLGQIVGCHAVGVLLVGIEVVHTWRLGIEAKACTDVEPSGDGERRVETG